MYALTYRSAYANTPRWRSIAAQRTTAHNTLVQNLLNGHRVQTKLTIGAANDRFEQEADRVADQVMAHPSVAEPSVAQAGRPDVVRRSTESPFAIEDGRLVGDEQASAQASVQAKAESASPTPASVDSEVKISSVVNNMGLPMPDNTRAFMEQRFGQDFSGVRVHTGQAAEKAASAINARAFTKGQSIVFARGQYSPQSEQGKHLLAHELTHVVQQGASSALPHDSVSSIPQINDDDYSDTVRRIRWTTATDTGQDSYPWGTGPKGDVFRVKTDAGNTINAWKPHDGTTYWCHGYTFGGSTAAGGPFSIWGQDVGRVLSDDGWQHEYSCVAQADDILVFAGTNVAHSGVVFSAFEPNGIIDETNSMLDSKWGQGSQNRSSWRINARKYGRYRVYSKNPAFGPCAGEGPYER